MEGPKEVEQKFGGVMAAEMRRIDIAEDGQAN